MQNYIETINFSLFEKRDVMLKADLRQPDKTAIQSGLKAKKTLREIGYQEPYMMELSSDGKIIHPSGKLFEVDP